MWFAYYSKYIYYSNQVYAICVLERFVVHIKYVTYLINDAMLIQSTLTESTD